MEDLLRSHRARKNLGKPIPYQFPALEREEAILRFGTFVMFAAGPNRGKSLLALNLAVRAGLLTLYISPDMASGEAAKRIAALLTGQTLHEVSQAFEGDDIGDYEEIISYSLNNKMRFVWDSSLTLDEYNSEVNAFAIAYGSWPELIIVDNMRDLFADEDKFQSWQVIEQHLKGSALSTGALVIGLHHLTGMYADGVESPPITAIEGQISKKANMVLTLWGSALSGTMKANIVKNKDGPSSPAGNLTATLQVDYAKGEVLG